MSTNPALASSTPLLRLSGLPTTYLPPTTSPGTTLTFLTTLLTQSLPFLNSIPSSPPWNPTATKHHPSSTAPIQLLARRVDTEIWSCRRSLHVDSAQPGTASWEEFTRGIKDEHAVAEAEYTPGIVAQRTGRSWEVGGVEVEVQGQRWGECTMRLEEARHAIGRPVLKDRIFTVLQVTASRMGQGEGEGKREFVVVSVPVTDWETELAKDGEAQHVRGAYVAVERVSKLDTGEIEWAMATASDAKGNLPMWLQTRAVPGQIAKDVGLFLGWCARKRA